MINSKREDRVSTDSLTESVTDSVTRTVSHCLSLSDTDRQTRTAWPWPGEETALSAPNDVTPQFSHDSAWVLGRKSTISCV